MPLKEALGYINRFIEQEGFRVVLISNQALMEPATATVWDVFKEKLVGRTLRLVPNPEAAYPEFVTTMTSEKAKEIATTERSAALSLFEASQRENLRSLRFGLESFDRVMRVLEPTLLTRAEGLKDILLGCLYISIEYGANTDEQSIVNPHYHRIRSLIQIQNLQNLLLLRRSQRVLLRVTVILFSCSPPRFPSSMFSHSLRGVIS
jgi:hypothetical protein